VQFDFDPTKVTYEQLVDRFFAFHDATRASSKRQYMSAIFVSDPEQEQIARSVMQRVQDASKTTLKTSILPAGEFYLAEDYHQKYALQGNTFLKKEYLAMYPDIWDLVDSPAATRVNAYLYGFGTAEQLAAEFDKLGLSEEGKARLESAGPSGFCRVE
jgi:peptide-methionine (S)-S-oxide reductase